MRWRTRQAGDTRERIKFAWLPTRTDDNETIWLEFIHVKEEYIVNWDYQYWKEVSIRPLDKSNKTNSIDISRRKNIG